MHQLGRNSCQRNTSTDFTEPTVVNLRVDQRDAVERIAVTFGLSASDVVRWIIDQGIEAVESVPSYERLRAMKR